MVGDRLICRDESGRLVGRYCRKEVLTLMALLENVWRHDYRQRATTPDAKLTILLWGGEPGAGGVIDLGFWDQDYYFNFRLSCIEATELRGHILRGYCASEIKTELLCWDGFDKLGRLRPVGIKLQKALPRKSFRTKTAKTAKTC